MTRRRRPNLWVLALALSACGSTVPLSGEFDTGRSSGPLSAPIPSSAPGGAVPGAGVTQVPGAGGSSVSTAGPGRSGPIGTGGSLGGQTGTSGQPPGERSTGGSGAGNPAPVGPGVTTNTINLGFYIPKNGDKAFGAIGVDIATGDGQAQTTAIVDHLNANGGIAGRKIVPLFFSYDLANPDTAGQDEAACTYWAQDHKTFAVFSVNQESDLLLTCLASRGTMYIADNKSIDNATQNKVTPYFWAPGDFLAERFARSYVMSLHEQGFLPKGIKVGLLIRDAPRNVRVAENVVRPALKAIGAELTKVGTVPYGASGSNQQANVLSFADADITRVLALEVNPLLFMQQAESQRYRPRYGLHSGYSPGGVLQTAAPRNQLVGARGMGWIPVSDVDSANDPGPVSPRQTLCFDLMRKAGQDPTVRVTALIMLWWCDTVFFLDDVLEQVPTPHATSFATAAARVGARTASAVTFKRDLPSGRVDGASAYRPVAFVEACSCFRYAGPVRPLP